MGKISITDWIQLLGAGAIAAGIVLVLIELQQNRQITAAQLMAQQFDAISDRYLTVMGEDSAATLAKACHDPETIGPQEQIVLDAYLNAQFLTIRRMRELSQIGDFGGSATIWRGWTKGEFHYIFAYPQSTAWWTEMREIYMPVFPKVVEIGDQVLASLDDEYFCKSYFQGWPSVESKQ